jgi:AbrB family looped-hinge helix DNA binding protein
MYAGVTHVKPMKNYRLELTFDTKKVRCYLTFMNTTLSSRGQIVLPAEIRSQDNLFAGQAFEIERIDCGEYRLVRRFNRPNEGLVDWLVACPEKGFFVPVESEGTDTLCGIL